MKKALKKLLAVTMMATICCVMSTPVTAKAVNPGACTHDRKIMGLYVEEGSYEHSYLYEAVDDELGPEVIEVTCTVYTETTWYAWYCQPCGQLLSIIYEEEPVDYQETHSMAGKYHHDAFWDGN